MLKKAIISTAILFLFAVPMLFIIFPFYASAEGLVPCTGINCTICDFFKLFQNIFNRALIIVPIVAVIFISIGGYYFMTSGGDTGRVTKAKNILKETFIGIAIFYSAYVLASFMLGFFANSNGGIDFGFRDGGFTFSCSGGGIENKIGGLLDGGRIIIDIPGEPAKEVKISQVDRLNIVSGVNLSGLDDEVNTKLNDASLDSELGAQGIGLLITDGKRSVQEQKELVSKNCVVGATSSKQCTPETCVPQGSGLNCNHVSGKAVDVWAAKKGVQDKSQQNEVIRAMQASGFCVLKSENWHFELKSHVEETKRLGAFSCP